jgi:hypothetical protein
MSDWGYSVMVETMTQPKLPIFQKNSGFHQINVDVLRPF